MSSSLFASHMPHTVSLHFPADDPAYQDHFPAAPVIPGTVLLKAVCRAAEEIVNGTVTEVRNVRFRQFLVPERYVAELVVTQAGPAGACSTHICPTGKLPTGECLTGKCPKDVCSANGYPTNVYSETPQEHTDSKRPNEQHDDNTVSEVVFRILKQGRPAATGTVVLGHFNNSAIVPPSDTEKNTHA